MAKRQRSAGQEEISLCSNNSSRSAHSRRPWALLSLLRALLQLTTLDPKEDCHDTEVSGQKHGAGKVGANADKSIPVHQKVEKEALVQVLQQIVQASEGAFHHATHCHLVMPSLALWLQSHRIDMVWDKAAMGTSGITQALSQHTSQYSFQSVLVVIAVSIDALDCRLNSHLPPSNVDNRVDQIQVRKLAIRAIILNVHTVKPMLKRIVDRNSTL